MRVRQLDRASSEDMNPRLAAALLAMSISACGGGTHAVVSSPCRGIDPWTGAALRRCMALVSRWAPAHSVPLTTHITPRVSSTCEQARRAVRMPVVCPPLVPTGGVVADPGLYLRAEGFVLRRPGVLVPWDEFRDVSVGKLDLNKAAVLTLGHPSTTLMMPLRLYDRLRSHMPGHLRRRV